MLKKIVLAVATVLLLMGCSEDTTEKVLRVAHDATWPPMEYVDANTRKIVGYSVDYIDAIARETGVKVEHRNVSWAGIFKELYAKRCDVISSSVTITEERKATMDFSIPYYTVQQAVVTRKEATFASREDLEGKRLGAQASTTGYLAAKRISPEALQSYDAIGYYIEDLKNGRLDAVICDDPVAADFVLQGGSNTEQLKIAFIIQDAEIEHYGFAVRKGDEKTLAILNKGIQAVKEKGIEAELIKKWIGKELGKKE